MLFRVLVRLALFRNSGYKMLLHGGEIPNDDNHLNASTSQREAGGSMNPDGYHGTAFLRNNHGRNPWNLEGRALSALNVFGENARVVSNPAWLRRVQHQHAIMGPPTPSKYLYQIQRWVRKVIKFYKILLIKVCNHTDPVVERPTLSDILAKKGLRGALFVAGEVLFISRPLIYVLFIRKYGIRSWTPWFLSLAVDFIGTGILSQCMLLEDGSKKQFHLSESEKHEVRVFHISFLILLTLLGAPGR